ncbi:hypothetical protein [Nesterenkonia muleiensis]|uniref:hypothetical protein n=1 Tax=Nesterenkonia muleiensis TaxID=2282648 RepID=UPI001300960B|nr:hypothetical protein [Nesterenkonia muleiensis]
MSNTFELTEWLGIEPKDVGVLSGILRTTEDDHELVWASIIFAPSDVADAEWPLQGIHPTHQAAKGLAARSPWLAVRVTLTQADAHSWLNDTLLGHSPDLGSLPALHPTYSRADTPMLLCPKADTPRSSVIARVGRPVDGFWFPANGEPLAMSNGDASALASISGMRMTPGLTGERTHDRGLLVSKLRRDAWLVDVVGGKNLETFKVSVMADQNRVSFSDLELELEEQINGEVSDIRRLRLRDIRLPDVSENEWITASLPTLGSNVDRRVRLWHSDGRLLDQTSMFHIAEQISAQISLMGTNHRLNVSVGEKPEVQLPARLERARNVGQQLTELLQDAMTGRIVSTRNESESRIQQELRNARDELLVLDPYFGSHPEDWNLLSAVTIPVRVLSGRSAKGPPLNVSAKKWSIGTPPFHDRFYLWTNGGISVGTSPSGFGKRIFRIDKLDAAESLYLSQRFETWWQDTKAIDL